MNTMCLCGRIFMVLVYMSLVSSFNVPKIIAHKLSPKSNKRSISIRPQSSSPLRMSDAAVMSPLFVTQLAACTSIIGMGAYVETMAEGTMEIEECAVDDNLLGGEYDIYRDSPLRYAGYLNEVGEAFRPLVPDLVVTLSYVAALSYVFADTLSKGNAAAKEQLGDYGCGQAAIFECLTFQMLASIIFPSFIINRWVALWGILSSDVLDTTTVISNSFNVAPDATIGSIGSVVITPESITNEIPTIAGLVLIPLIVKQIDALTEKILDLAVRPVLLRKYPNCC